MAFCCWKLPHRSVGSSSGNCQNPPGKCWSSLTIRTTISMRRLGPCRCRGQLSRVYVTQITIYFTTFSISLFCSASLMDSVLNNVVNPIPTINGISSPRREKKVALDGIQCEWIMSGLETVASMSHNWRQQSTQSPKFCTKSAKRSPTLHRTSKLLPVIWKHFRRNCNYFLKYLKANEAMPIKYIGLLLR